MAAHFEFFDAGAQVATTASYQASFPGFATLGLDTAQAADLMRLSVALARRARDESRPDGWVAACRPLHCSPYQFLHSRAPR